MAASDGFAGILFFFAFDLTKDLKNKSFLLNCWLFY
jgi:hypothetical protein